MVIATIKLPTLFLMKRWLKISRKFIILQFRYLFRTNQKRVSWFLLFTMFWKSRHLEFLLVKPYREQLTHLKNAHFINMKKRDLFEWYKDGCTKTCKNFLAWLFFFTLWGFAISAFFHEYSYWEIYWHEIDIFDPTYRQVSYHPEITYYII